MTRPITIFTGQWMRDSTASRAGPKRLKGGPEALAFVREHAIEASAAAFDATFSVNKENTDD